MGKKKDRRTHADTNSNIITEGNEKLIHLPPPTPQSRCRNAEKHTHTCVNLCSEGQIKVVSERSEMGREVRVGVGGRSSVTGQSD